MLSEDRYNAAMGWRAILRVTAYSATVGGGVALMTYGGLGIPIGLGLVALVAPWLSDPSERWRRIRTGEPWFDVPRLAMTAFVVLSVFAVGVLFALKLIGVSAKSQMSDRTRIIIVGLTGIAAAIAEWHTQRTKSKTPVKPAQG